MIAAAACTFAGLPSWAQGTAVATATGSKVSLGSNAVGGTAAAAAAGGTSASTVGIGAHSIASSSSVVGSGGSAAAVGGKATSTTRIGNNSQMLRAQSKARAADGGIWSRSMTNTTVRHAGDVRSWSKSMSHEPGFKPAMARTRIR
jgi:hypothetical protein